MLTLFAIACVCLVILWALSEEGQLTWSKARREALQERATRLLKAAQELEQIDHGEYMPARHLRKWLLSWPDLEPLSTKSAGRLPPALREEYRAISELIESPEGYRKRRNEAFVTKRLDVLTEWFDTLAKHPLTAAQRRAVVINEDHTLVVAAAGTGKTTTLEAKVAYLLSRGLAKPEEILVLAFNRKVANEVAERLERSTHGQGVLASTFHAMGSNIVGQSDGRKAPLSPLAEDTRLRMKLFQEVLFEYLSVPDYRSVIRTWFIDELMDKASFDNCRTPEEREARERGQGRIALNGDTFRSHSEVRVANWLILNGIDWSYEPIYPHSASQPNRRDYTPDFYLPTHDLWLEVWAVDKKNKTAPHINAKTYVESMQWKRAQHACFHTQLAEIDQDEIWSGNLDQILTEKLSGLGLKPNPVSAEELRETLKQATVTVSAFCELVDSFIQLARSGNFNLETLRDKAATRRETVFLKLVQPFIETYEKRLEQERRIDFHDMLLKAAKRIRDGAFTPKWKFVLVDETQDFSRARLELVQAIRDHAQDVSVVLVGDDWQSIYRFTGADVSFFTEANIHLGFTARVDLDESFRIADDVMSLSSVFIMENPAQLQKTVSPARANHKPGVAIHLYKDTGGGANWRKNRDRSAQEALRSIFEEIREEARPDDRVLVLARYHHVLDAIKSDISTLSKGSNLKVECLSVHAAKGLEADHVILLDVSSGRYGFPAGILDDPILGLVQASPDHFPFSEERRLFYVSLTRTRGRVFLASPVTRQSPFIQELLAEKYRSRVELVGGISELYVCPNCQGRTIFHREGDYGSFWACLRYPKCDGKLPHCDSCSSGALEPRFVEKTLRGWTCFECQKTCEVCPSCRKGAVKMKSGKYGQFYGCSNWRRNGTGCKHTRNPGGSGRRRRRR